MTKQTLNKIKKILARSCWTLLGVGVIVLLISARNKKSLMVCQKVEITIKGVHNNIFIDEKDVEKILHSVIDGELVGKPLKYFDLSEIQETLQKNDWIKRAEVYFDNNEILWVNITEREPIARIFTTVGETFYIDSNNLKIPISGKFSARLPVFTGLRDTMKTKDDSLLLNNIKKLSLYILADSFWMAQIDQVDITKDNTFEMIPKIGNQLILFGNADNYQEKFHYLFLFYKNVLSKVGWNKYSTISVEYRGQIISVKRGVNEVKMDSLKTADIMNSILLKAQMQISDTTSIQLSQKDDNTQQVIPLINADLPDETIGLFQGSVFKPVVKNNSSIIKNDSIVKKEAKKDSVPIQTRIISKKAIDHKEKQSEKRINEKVKPLVGKNQKTKKTTSSEY